MNPCIDCRILLFKKAKEYMEIEKAQFIITGEVLGQRPMSQRKAAMKLIDKESKTEGLVLRPLCAKFMEESIPEKNGWVDREKLLAINGRARGVQFGLARHFGINDYPCPSGGCLLTYPDFAKRVKDLIEHDELTLASARLLRLGRHFRLSSMAKLIVGRSEAENTCLLDFADESGHVFMPREDIAGPTSLGIGLYNDKLINLAARITGRYCDLGENSCVDIDYKRGSGAERKFISRFSVSPAEENLLEALRI
jgi:tRNA U34 2-thiouridine synthase MnmA/TrmU